MITERNYLSSLALLFTSAALTVFPVISDASNGYFAHGFGARSKAMAGAATALPQDAFAAATNPAGMAYMGDRLDLEVRIFKSSQQYTVEGLPVFAPGAFPLNPGTFKSDDEWFPMPALGWSHKIDAEQTLGMAFYANGGLIVECFARCQDRRANYTIEYY